MSDGQCSRAAGRLQEERRITKAGGKVLQMSNASGRRVGPHRVFNKERTAPGLAMSRSLGDGYAHSLGVSAAPTCTAHKLTPSDQFVVRLRCSHQHDPAICTAGPQPALERALTSAFMEARKSCNRHVLLQK